MLAVLPWYIARAAIYRTPVSKQGPFPAWLELGCRQPCVIWAIISNSLWLCRAGRTRETQPKRVAIKHIDRLFDIREDALRIVRELRFLRLLQHANVRTRPRMFRTTPDRILHCCRLWPSRMYCFHETVAVSTTFTLSLSYLTRI